MVAITFWERVWGQDHGGVARVNPGVLDVFQDATHDDGAFGRIIKPAHVRNAVHVHLGRVLEELIH